MNSRELGNKWSLPYSFEAIGDICAEEENFNKAVQLYGAASALREALGLTFSAAEQTEYEAALNRLHENLSVADFEAGWNLGKALTIEGAIQLAQAG